MIPTAKEFLLEPYKSINVELSDLELKIFTEKLIEFAKLHVEQALKEASEQAYVSDTVFCEIDRDSILNAYPLKNIK